MAKETKTNEKNWFQRWRHRKPGSKNVERKEQVVLGLGKVESLELFLRICAHLAQVAIVGVLFIGYWYTIKPVFQKELLSEEVAQLRLEQKQLLDQEGEFRVTLSELQRDIQDRTDELGFVAGQLSLEEGKLENAEVRLSDAVDRLADAEAQIDSAEDRIYILRKSELTGKTPLPIAVAVLLRANRARNEAFTYSSATTTAVELESQFLWPAELAQLQLNELRERIDQEDAGVSRDALVRLSGEFERGIEERFSILECNVPDVAAWQDAFIMSTERTPEIVEECVASRFENLIREERWTDQRVSVLKESEFWPRQTNAFYGTCEVYVKYTVERFFRESWNESAAPCEERARRIASIVLGDSVEDLPPLRDTAPPSRERFEAAILEAMNDW